MGIGTHTGTSDSPVDSEKLSPWDSLSLEKSDLDCEEKIVCEDAAKLLRLSDSLNQPTVWSIAPAPDGPEIPVPDEFPLPTSVETPAPRLGPVPVPVLDVVEVERP